MLVIPEQVCSKASTSVSPWAPTAKGICYFCVLTIWVFTNHWGQSGLCSVLIWGPQNWLITQEIQVQVYPEHKLLEVVLPVHRFHWKSCSKWMFLMFWNHVLKTSFTQCRYRLCIMAMSALHRQQKESHYRVWIRKWRNLNTQVQVSGSGLSPHQYKSVCFRLKTFKCWCFVRYSWVLSPCDQKITALMQIV